MQTLRKIIFVICPGADFSRGRRFFFAGAIYEKLIVREKIRVPRTRGCYRVKGVVECCIVDALTMTRCLFPPRQKIRVIEVVSCDRDDATKQQQSSVK